MPSTERRRRWLGLRGRIVATFALGALLVSLMLVVSVYTISRGYLTEQRERTVTRQAAADAGYVRDHLASSEISAPDLLAAVDPPAGTTLLLYRHGQWFTSEPGTGPAELPGELLHRVGAEPSSAAVTVRGEPFLAVGVRLNGVDTGEDAEFYRLAPLQELAATLGVLRTVLVACALAATLGAAALGWWASRRVLQPLHALASTAASIAGGQLDTRLPAGDDRDLATIAGPFNRMVDSLQARIERERRFVADVSHELRTPLTTLVASVEVMRRHDRDLPDRPRRALGLVSTELDHLRHLLDDLLALARTQAGLHQDELEPLSLRELLTHTLARADRPATLLGVETDTVVNGRKLALERAFVNLMDNADKHGGGLVGVTLRRDGGHAVVEVDDNGPGVPAADRKRVFERFATGSAPRGHTAGTGLGLALVAETVTAHGGCTRCTDRPGGGARFVVTIPAVGHTG